MIAADAQLVADDLHVGVAVAEVPGEPGEVMRGGGGDLDQRLGAADHAHDAAVVEQETITVVQDGRVRQVEQERRAALARQRDATAVPLVEIEHNLVDGVWHRSSCRQR